MSIAREMSVKQVRGVHVAELRVGRVDRLASGGAVGSQPVCDELHRLLPVGSVERVLVEGGRLGGHPHRSGRKPAEGGCALRDLVDERQHRLGDHVVELVELDEVGPLDVPVRLLHLAVEVERVRETRVEQIDELLAILDREVVAGLEHRPCLGGHPGAPFGESESRAWAIDGRAPVFYPRLGAWKPLAA